MAAAESLLFSARQLLAHAYKLLTGRHPIRSGVFGPNWSTRPEEITIAQISEEGGYRTGHFGKWHVGAVKAESPTNPGRNGI